MADVLSQLALTTSSMASLFVALVLGLVGVVFYLMYNSKYPVINFLVFDRGNLRIEIRRLKGNMAVKSTLINILLDKTVFGEDVNKFTYVIWKGKKYYLARITDTGILIPIELSPSILKELNEDQKEILKWKLIDRWILTGKKQAMEFINAYTATEKTADKSNPIIIGLLANLPIILTMAIIAVVLITTLNFIAGTFQPMINTLDAISQRVSVVNNSTIVNSTTTSSTIAIG